MSFENSEEFYSQDEVKTERYQKAFNEYYSETETTILVPVKIRYHYATDTLFNYSIPSTEEVQNALYVHNEFMYVSLKRLVHNPNISEDEKQAVEKVLKIIELSKNQNEM